MSEQSFIIEHRDVFRCKWCGKPYLRKHDMEYHAYMCKNNPENVHPCFWCDQLEKKDARVQFEWIGGFGEYHEEFHDVPSFYCKKHDQWMYSRLACKHDHPCSKDGDHLQMPTECKDFFYKDLNGNTVSWSFESFVGKLFFEKHSQKAEKKKGGVMNSTDEIANMHDMLDKTMKFLRDMSEWLVKMRGMNGSPMVRVMRERADDIEKLLKSQAEA